MTDRIAIIGLGAMGLPMARRLAGGFAVSGFDPFAERRQLAEADGIRVAQTPAAAAGDADVVVLAVRDAAQVRQALFGADGVAGALRPDGSVVLTSTIGLDAARAIDAELRERGLTLVDAPVSGGPLRAGTGDLLIVVGAPPADRAAVDPVLQRLASTLTVAGDRIGDGQILKTINQLLAGVHIAAAAEAVALGRELGLDPDAMIPVLGAGAAASFMLGDRGPRMADAYRGGAEVRSRVDIFVKDMGIVSDLAHSAQVPTPLAAAALQVYQLAQRAGLGASDDSSIVTLYSPVGDKEEAR